MALIARHIALGTRRVTEADDARKTVDAYATMAEMLLVFGVKSARVESSEKTVSARAITRNHAPRTDAAAVTHPVIAMMDGLAHAAKRVRLGVSVQIVRRCALKIRAATVIAAPRGASAILALRALGAHHVRRAMETGVTRHAVLRKRAMAQVDVHPRDPACAFQHSIVAGCGNSLRTRLLLTLP